MSNTETFQEPTHETQTAPPMQRLLPTIEPTETKTLTLFDHLIQIAVIHEDRKGAPDTIFEYAKEHINAVCEQLELTPTQAVLFADILSHTSEGCSVSPSVLAETMGCKRVEVYKYLDDIHVLEHKNLIDGLQNPRRNFGDRGLSFGVPLETLTALQKGRTPAHIWSEKLTADEFLDRTAKLCEKRIEKEENYDQTLKKFTWIMEANQHIGIVRMLSSYGLSQENELLLLRFCLNYLYREDDHMTLAGIERFYQHRAAFGQSRRELMMGKHILQQKMLIENVNDGGFASKESFSLTEKAQDELLVEYAELLGKTAIRDMIVPDSIVEKPLFYPDKTARSVQELSELFKEENMRRVRENLVKSGMRTGFACLFSGAPGTGKTETARQVARATGRGIVQVDIANTKSMWFGQSEKQIKEVFNRYRAAVKSSDVMPILLFNEADAVIGKRQALGTTRNGPGQTENAIQNIILQEIENLDGILIATTNLTQNMDSAFERRFLYKIEFEKPTQEERKQIWRALIPDLSEEEVAALAGRFDFSGGQIENISRRRTVASVLHGASPDLDALMVFCEDESSGEKVKRIGFAV